MAYGWTEDRIEMLRSLHGTASIQEIANTMGTTKSSIRGMVTRLGIAKKLSWTEEEEAILIDAYTGAGEGGCVSLAELAKTLCRDKANVCRKAKSLGLPMNAGRRRVSAYKRKPSNRKFETDEELRAFRSKLISDRHKRHGHHMKGKRHSAEALRKMSFASKERWAGMSDEDKMEFSDRAYKAALQAGKLGSPKVRRGSWKAQWREVGGKRNFYRSEWEANYACYLQFLKERGEIQDWEHEPETFWFESIRRGTRSYKPDFRVWEKNGASNLHEVKGWMDQRSRTTLSRMAKYYPEEQIILITQKEYSSISLMRSLIPGWT